MPVDEDQQRIKNYILYKLPLTNKELEESSPAIVVLAIGVTVMIGFFIWWMR